MKPTEKDILIARHTIPHSATVRDALHALNSLSGDSMTLFVVNAEREMMGSVTDGDIRRALISDTSLDDSVSHVMHRDALTVASEAELPRAIPEGRRRRIGLLPVLDGKRISDIIDLRKVKTRLPLDAILMAGGRGERLRPLTETVPKPLLPVGGKAIIDYNVDELEACGVKNIWVTVNYLASQIESHFSRREGSAVIECVREPERLGTMGSVAYAEGLSQPDVLLMNSDLLTNLDFGEMFLNHTSSGNDITMAAIPYNISVPFALMQTEGGRVTGLEEKPTFNHFANAGVYMMKRELLRRVEKGKYLDTPDFIAQAISDGLKVGFFPIEGTWIDIGSPDDYRYANELMARKWKA